MFRVWGLGLKMAQRLVMGFTGREGFWFKVQGLLLGNESPEP